MPELRDRTITMGSLSKTFSITGWRIGFVAADARWTRMIGYMNDLVYVCAPAPLQMGVARGLDSVPESYYRDSQPSTSKARTFHLLDTDRRGVDPVHPAGAYYVLADLSRLPGQTSKDRAMALLERTGVATVPGESFYRPGEGETMTRFCFAKTMTDLEEACRRLRKL